MTEKAKSYSHIRDMYSETPFVSSGSTGSEY